MLKLIKLESGEKDRKVLYTYIDKNIESELISEQYWVVATLPFFENKDNSGDCKINLEFDTFGDVRFDIKEDAIKAFENYKVA